MNRSFLVNNFEYSLIWDDNKSIDIGFGITSSSSALINSKGRGDIFPTKFSGSMGAIFEVIWSPNPSTPDMALNPPPAIQITGTSTLSSTPQKTVPAIPPRLIPIKPVFDVSISERVSR